MNMPNQDFEKDGYIVIRGFMPADEVAPLEQEINRYIENVVPQLDPTEVFYEDKNNKATIKQLPRMCRHDPYFKQLLNSAKFVELAETLLGGRVRPMHIQWFNKPPHDGRQTPPHQDGAFGSLEPNDAVTVWLAMDAINEENGCLRYQPGSHRSGIRKHARTDILGFSQGIAGYTKEDLEKEVTICAEPGDLLVHHFATVHRADANHSDRTRRAFSLVYYGEWVKQDEEADQAYVNQVNADMAKAGKV